MKNFYEDLGGGGHSGALKRNRYWSWRFTADVAILVHQMLIQTANSIAHVPKTQHSSSRLQVPMLDSTNALYFYNTFFSYPLFMHLPYYIRFSSIENVENFIMLSFLCPGILFLASTASVLIFYNTLITPKRSALDHNYC